MGPGNRGEVFPWCLFSKKILILLISPDPYDPIQPSLPPKSSFSKYSNIGCTASVYQLGCWGTVQSTVLLFPCLAPYFHSWLEGLHLSGALPGLLMVVMVMVDGLRRVDWSKQH